MLTEHRFELDACGVFNPRLQVAGWAEAAAAENDGRNDAMLGLDESICGLAVKPLAWRHLLWLDIYNSPFLLDAPADLLLQIPDIHLHVARFMWVLSPAWWPFRRQATGGWNYAARKKLYYMRYAWALYGRPNNTEEIVRAIVQFMDDSVYDMKSGSKGPRRKSYYSAAAGVVRALCKENGSLSPDPNAPNAAIDVSLKIVGQLFRASIRQADPKALLTNRTDDLERQWLEEYNRRLNRN